MTLQIYELIFALNIPVLPAKKITQIYIRHQSHHIGQNFSYLHVFCPIFTLSDTVFRSYMQKNRIFAP